MKSDSIPGINQQDAANDLSATQIPVLFQSGLALHHRGQLTQAQEIYQQVLTLQPRHSEALHLLGVIAAHARNNVQALDLIGRSIEINPNNAIALANLGKVLKALGQHEAAIESYDKAGALKPDYAHVFFDRGMALYELKQYQAAIDSYDKAIAIRPDIAETYINRGLALAEWKHPEAAIASYDKAIALNPNIAEAYFNRGLALKELKLYLAAIDSFERAFAIRPGYDFLYGERLSTKIAICDWHDAEDEIAELISRIQRNEKATPPFAVLALSPSLPLQRKAAEIWVNEKSPANPKLGLIPKRPKRQKIRLGYFSADFHNHATAYLMAELFECHDKDQFELFAFSFGPDVTDEMRHRLVAAFDRFMDVRDQPDQEVAALSRSLEIDIAIDLKGFTRDGRIGIFSYRAAPVQVNYLGYPGTLGAPYMDYLIADRNLIPEASQQHYCEKIAYLPNSYQVNDTRRTIADKVFSREELGLPESGFVFCCFNNNFKITPDTFDGWMRILNRVHGSVLWLFEDNPSAADNLRKEAQRRGMNPQRLVFAKRMPLPEHLARHRAADLFIDTLPCNAHTTASDALWSGLPVLTCTGEAFASRVAASLLTAIDLPELITSTQEDYEALAVELATDPERLTAIRQKLERNRLTTPLFDTRLFSRNIEQAYTQMFERYQADLPPEHFYVDAPRF